MLKILKLNEISEVADKVFDGKYAFSKNEENPVGIMLRSFKMHDYPLNDELLAVARAGAGTNNVPVEKCAEKGIVVFNTPGANANAVKELAIAMLLLSSRKITAGINWANTLENDVAKTVESGKGAFVGPEIYGKKLGVIGLGAIGVMVANAAVHLGMEVYGYDPYISIDAAWTLSRDVKHIKSLDALLSSVDYVTLHVPLNDSTKGMINANAIAKMKDGVRIINCSRAELANDEDVLAAIESGKIATYVTDFANEKLINKENVICTPHLGASTPEAEDNCAEMAAKQLCEYIENGNIVNSVNYPACSMPRTGVARITVCHKNVKNILSQLAGILGESGINISDMLNKSKGDFAYSIFELDNDFNEATLDALRAVDGVLRVRAFH